MKLFFILIGIYLTLDGIIMCQETNSVVSHDIEMVLQQSKDIPIEIFSGLSIWKRNEGYVIDSVNNNCRFLVIQKNNELLFKQLFPEQDTAFHDLNTLYHRQEKYRSAILAFPDLINYFRKLDFDQIISIKNDLVILMVRDDFNLIYTKNEFDNKTTERFRYYTKYDKNWYFYKKDN